MKIYHSQRNKWNFWILVITLNQFETRSGSITTWGLSGARTEHFIPNWEYWVLRFLVWNIKYCKTTRLKKTFSSKYHQYYQFGIKKFPFWYSNPRQLFVPRSEFQNHQLQESAEKFDSQRVLLFCRFLCKRSMFCGVLLCYETKIRRLLTESSLVIIINKSKASV